MPVTEIRHPRRGPGLRFWIVAAVILLFIGARTIAGYVIEFAWWREIGQIETWTSMLLYGVLPVIVAGVVIFAILWTAHARGMKHGGTSLRYHPVYARVTTLILLLVSIILATATVDSWTIVRYFGSRYAAGAGAEWQDPVFHKPLTFYLFDIPFFSEMLSFLMAVTLAAIVIHWLTARGWQLRDRLPDLQSGAIELDLTDLRWSGASQSTFLRAAAALFLIGLAGRTYFSRYNLLHKDHGFLVGIDYTDEKVLLPLIWAVIVSSLIAAAFALIGKFKFLLLPAVFFLIQAVIPGLVSQFYVKPNELALQRPYIQRHIEATRAAFGLEKALKEVQYPATLEGRIDISKHKVLLDNVRLWDWRAFHDTVTQLQALRQYYVFHDTDVDRYTLDGQLRQVMLTPRELDVRQLGEAQANWINTHFIYTHGYGLVMAEASRITPNGQPVLFIQDAPPKIETASLKLTRPEIYFGELTHEPVFVRTQQPEFNYPAGSDNVQTRYEGKGGIPIGSFGMRLIAALAYTDRNVLLTGLLTNDSRMLIRRKVADRLRHVADFLEWDPDPYLVVTQDGRQVWMIDGYTTSTQHPYSRAIRMRELGAMNYVRNSVKAVIDAYDGTVSLYVFDENDPIVRAWRGIFPTLFKNAQEMPADLRAHARYPESLFRAQAEVYRTYHMRDPESFYNKEDLWDLARTAHGDQRGTAQPAPPTFVVATLPGESKPEYLLMQSFTPRSKDNLIGVMMARCDGEKLGEVVVLQLSKQSLIYGPLQIESRIDSDQNISKDLSLWNQQGSQVLRGQMLVLPIDDTFLYIEPIYIQAAQARMPQLRKVVLAVGNTLIYRDTYEQALAELGGTTPPAPAKAEEPVKTSQAVPPAPTGDARLESVRGHLRRYRELSAQGKWAEAGRELEALEALVGRAGP